MAIISDYDEGENKSPAKPSPSSSASTVPFTGDLDRSNPIGFIEKVFDFIAGESDYLGKDSAEREIASIVRAASEKQKLKEKAKAAEEVLAPPPVEKEEKAVPDVVMKDAEAEKEEEKSGLKGMLLGFPINLMWICSGLV